MILTHVLVNCYNASWPTEFQPVGFCVGESQMPIDPDDLKRMPEDEAKAMAARLIESNVGIKSTPFYQTYLFPMEQILNT